MTLLKEAPGGMNHEENKPLTTTWVEAVRFKNEETTV